MTFYSVRRIDENTLKFTMNPFIRGVLVFILFSLILAYTLSMTSGDFQNASTLGKINTFLFPLVVFLGASYRYSLTFDKTLQVCIVAKGLVFLNRKETYSFDDLTGLNYRIYDFNQKEETNQFNRGIPRRSKADFGFFFNGKLLQLEKGAPKRGVEVLYLTFTSFFPRELFVQ